MGGDDDGRFECVHVTAIAVPAILYLALDPFGQLMLTLPGFGDPRRHLPDASKLFLQKGLRHRLGSCRIHSESRAKSQR